MNLKPEKYRNFSGITLTKIKIKNGLCEICGLIEPGSGNITENTSVKITVNGKEELPLLTKTAFSNEINDCVLKFRTEIILSGKTEIGFFTGSENSGFVCAGIAFGEWVVFNPSRNRTAYVKDGYRLSSQKNIISVSPASAVSAVLYYIGRLFYYLFRNRKVFAVRLMNVFEKKDRVWLYTDCKGYNVDNAYFQFIHDFEKDDGVTRYYVTGDKPSDIRQYFSEKQFEFVIPLRSKKHKLLYLNAERLITAYVEKVNYIPFFDDVLPDYLDIVKNDTVYLQHGVLHAHLPEKYSYDCLDISREVISTEFERQNFTVNYFFPEQALICSKMPRYDFIDADKKTEKRKILFAPSWRKYLIELAGDGSKISKDNEFLSSLYFKETYNFLTCSLLSELLEKYDACLDFRPHPIFNCYRKYFTALPERVSLSEGDVRAEDYEIFITDYSSYVFDFVYLNRSIFYFFPDYDFFKNGENGYSSLDLPLENGFGKLTETAGDAVTELAGLLENGKNDDVYVQRCLKTFINRDRCSRDKIYDAIKEI